MEEKIFWHYFFENVKKSTLATSIVKNISLLDQTGP